ncbi:MAG: hypothetical protein AB1516_02730 [Pseudomonadota bacterium]|jgi:hypothetical protein|uniref:hypothetical protein n=1 Tax=Limnobacter alexandrii TaxID=2570352 RepID=UPI001107D591|nr:hypothetical protein [Limnobacter alexandrii]
MPASKRATEETSKPVSKTASKPVAKAEPPESKAARPVATTRKPSKTALSPSEVTPLALLTPSKPARRRRSGAAKPRKLKGATTTWPFPTGSRP